MRAFSSAIAALALACLVANAAHAQTVIAPAAPAARPETAPAPQTSPRAPDKASATTAVFGHVKRVQDGDSFVLITDGRETGVRIAGIDAPERTQAFADVSRRALRAKIERRDVRVDAVKTDYFGRIVGRVFLDDRDVGLTQLHDGLAWHFTRYDADLAPVERKRYAQAERSARERGAGLWRDPDPLAPWLFRRQQRR